MKRCCMNNGESVKKVIAVANQKGGVGKTTTSVNLSAALAGLGARVLLMDLDPQGNATMGSGVDKHDLRVSIYHWLMGDSTLQDTVKATVGHYDLMPSNIDLTAAEVALMQFDEREFVITKRLSEHPHVYDYIIVDCPPSLNILYSQCISCGHWRGGAHAMRYYALEGLSALLDTVDAFGPRRTPA